MDEYKTKVIDYFTDLITSYGDNIRSLDWGTEQGQKLRFSILNDIGINPKSSILDVGCGRGDFYGFLMEGGFSGLYKGIDITPRMVEIAKNRYGEELFSERDLIEFPLPDESFDFVLASGIFYLKLSDNMLFLEKMVEALFKISREGLAFNCLSDTARKKSGREFYYDSLEVVRYCDKLTPNVILRDDYKENDFTIYMKK